MVLLLSKCGCRGTHRIGTVSTLRIIIVGPHRAATYFCLESVCELALSDSLFGNLLVCFAVVPVLSPHGLATDPAKYNGG